MRFRRFNRLRMCASARMASVRRRRYQLVHTLPRLYPALHPDRAVADYNGEVAGSKRTPAMKT